MKRCYICGEDNKNVLQTHHVVPRRFDLYLDVEDDSNLVTLCANCHQAVESIYNKEFYSSLREYFVRDEIWNVQAKVRERIQESVERFIDKCCEIQTDGRTTEKTEFFETYEKFCELQGTPAVSRGLFDDRIRRRFRKIGTTTEYKDGEDVECWLNVSLEREPQIVYPDEQVSGGSK